MSVKRNNLQKQLLAVFLFVYVVSFAGSAFAVSGISRFVFVTDPQTISPDKLSDVLQIQAQDASGIKINTGETIYLEFSSTSLTGKFLNASSSPVRTWMNKGTANFTFYYRDSSAGVHTLTVKAQGRESKISWTVSQAITVSSNASVPSSSSTPAPSPAPAPTPPSPPPASAPAISSNAQISVDAGADQTATVGSLVEFKGIALGLKKEPLAPARFWWNFGDGETQEGKTTTHIFRIPGTYIVGLHVSSGEYSSSDYATVRVLENQMRVGGVISGGGGYIQIANPLNTEVDIGGWIIEDQSHKQFFIPGKTKIAAGADLSLSNAVTGLLAGKEPHSLAIQYPNGTVAFTYTVPTDQDSSTGSSATSSQSGKIQNIPPENPIATGSSVKSGAMRAKEESHPRNPAPDRNVALQNITEVHKNSAALAAGFSVSSRMMFAGAIGLSALGALGFFLLKHFLI